MLALVHSHGNRNDEFVKREMQEIRDEVEFYKENANVTWNELLKPSMLNRVHIACFTQVCLPSLLIENELTFNRSGRS